MSDFETLESGRASVLIDSAVVSMFLQFLCQKLQRALFLGPRGQKHRNLVLVTDMNCTGGLYPRLAVDLHREAFFCPAEGLYHHEGWEKSAQY